MIVLHAALDADARRVCFWGESPPGPPPRRRRPRGAGPHPYDSGSRLAGALNDAVPGLAAGGGEARVAWLPSTEGSPVPSSPLVAEAPTGRTRLLPWAVTAVPLQPRDAVSVLAACLHGETLAPGLVVSRDLAFWATVLRLAGGLVARQRFLPSLHDTGRGWRAEWTPVLEGADVERASALAAAMPGACRAITSSAEEAPQDGAAAVLGAFLGVVVDHLVRDARPAAPDGPAESVHEAWVRGLLSRDGRVAGERDELGRLAREVTAWTRPIAAAAAAPFRLCFALNEPGEGEATWPVQYLLQGARDPSLLIPAERAWQGRAERLLKSGTVREQLLASLGQAASLCPPVAESLKEPAPTGYTTDAAGAHAFLTGSAAALEQAGFGVILPAWWTGKGTRQRLTARATVRAPKMGGAGLGMDEVVRFEWEVALGGERLSRTELESLARLKAPLVRVRGQWVHVTADEIRTALDLWKKRGGAVSVRELVPMALGIGAETGPLAFEGVAASGWVGDLLHRLESRADFEELPPPPGLQGILRPYQQRGYSWLAFLRQWGLGACLADDMGLGKTVQTLALLLRERAASREPALLVCPMSVMGNWQREAERFTPGLPVLVHHGLGRGKGAAFQEAAREHALVVTSYALLHRDLEAFRQVAWSAVVLDEAQNVKNPETRQAAAARALSAGHRIALTGTPVENSVGDLWSLMEFLNPGLLGSQADFKRRFFVPIQATRDAAALARLQRVTGPFILRRLKTDRSVIADLPDKMEMKVFCTLTREQASLYAAVLREAERDLKGAAGIKRKGVVLATLSRLKQVCNHPAQLLGDNSPIPGRSGKLARLTEMMEEVLAAGDRALVFSQFAEMGGILQRHLQDAFGREVLFLHGGVPKGGRDRMVEAFQSVSGGGPQVFVLSLKAGGTGLNLTAASHVFHFDRWWNPAVESQATDRAYRIGQTRRVQVHTLVCLGTLEERIDALIEGKKSLAESVVGTGEGWLTELSTAELKEVLALRPEAVGE